MRKILSYLCCCFCLVISLTSVESNSWQASAREQPRKGVQSGLAVFYDRDLHGEKTASGEKYNQNELVAAHPSFPLGSIVRVSNLENGRTVLVRINDRGPGDAQVAKGMIIDLSREAAERLDFIKDGKTKVRLQVIEWGNEDKQ